MLLATHSAKALLFVLLFGAVVGKKSALGARAEELGGDSDWLSENWRGRWWVIWEF